LRANKVLFDFPFGFRPNHCTSLALIEVIDNIYYHLDNKDYGVGTYLDLQKAFDMLIMKYCYGNCLITV
jgi:hypothetical protein